MYTINGIDLQSSEFEELKMLIEASENGDDIQKIAFVRLHPTGNKYDFDSRATEIYTGLDHVGLIVGQRLFGGYDFGYIAQKGFDFIADYDKAQKAEHRQSVDRRRHDYKVAAFGAVCGTVSGGILGFLGGVFSAQIIEAISQVLWP